MSAKMVSAPDLAGVFAAAVTPLTADLQLDLSALPGLLEFLGGRGCHGALLLGTTGEGPSFSVRERADIFREAARWRAASRPDFKLLAGTGCANLADTIDLTRAAFELGVDGVVTLPAFYYKGVGPEGIAAYFERIVQEAVPAEGRLLVYHIPQVSGVGIPPQSVARLRERFPRQIVGMKDSEDNLAHTLATTQAFPGFRVFAGSDSIFADALAGGAVGCITALCNVLSPLNRAVWEAHLRGTTAPEGQAALTLARQIVKGLNGPAAMKSALADLFGFPRWGVRPPLEPLSVEQSHRLMEELAALT